jgi:hypothetical protein
MAMIPRNSKVMRLTIQIGARRRCPFNTTPRRPINLKIQAGAIATARGRTMSQRNDRQEKFGFTDENGFAVVMPTYKLFQVTEKLRVFPYQHIL